jgi:RimJ/RimL family protein N-acetyltransferase
VLRLRGNKILLRDFLPHDREQFLALESDEAMFTYMKFRIDRGSAESVQLPRLLEESHLDPRPSYNLVVEDANGFSGWAGIDRIQGTDNSQLGWYLASDRWGRGYATEATRLLLDFGFSVLHRATMWATADPENLASLRVLEKSGLTNRGLTDPVQTWRGLRPRVLFTIEAEQWGTSFRPSGASETGGSTVSGW